MKFVRIAALVCLLVLSLPAFACQAADEEKPTAAKPTAAAEPAKGPNFVPIDSLIQEQVNDEGITGAVLAVGHNGRIIHQKAFGYRALSPRREPMTVDTVFDLASLTKVVATTPSVLNLVQAGRLRLDDSVARYIPEFGANGKENVTIRQLLTHFSGLKPDLDLNPPWAGEETAFRMANEEKLQTPPGAQFVYSDINFIVLGELVQRLSGLPLDRYAVANVFEPLGMKRTRFLPPAEWHPRIAETLAIGNREILRGKVQDPTAQRMGGIAGDAGLFSTAGDLALYAQALIDRKKILSPDLIEKMTTPQQPPNAVEVRGLGWDIDSPFSTNRGALLPVGSFGHTGYTGTSIWIDPYTNTYIILLTNSVRPRTANVPVISLRGRVATAVAAALNLDVTSSARDRLFSITGYNELAPAARRIGPRNGSVLTGIDVLEKNNFAVLKSGKQSCCATDSQPTADHVLNIGLLTNQVGLDAQGRRTIDVLAAAPGVKLTAIFSPEHGITGSLDIENVTSTTDAATGLPVYSLYGAGDANRHPPLEVLKTLDAVVIDLQDSGVRFWSNNATLGYMLEAAAQTGTEVILLDRPNPVTGAYVQGPVSDGIKRGMTNYYPMPLRHGMTFGELAQMFNTEKKIGAHLRVVPMENWLRGDWFDSTGVMWVNPSPNLRSVNEATLYPGVSLIEQTNVSVGRGTDTPFELVGAPWIDARAFAEYLNSRLIAGVRFVPVTFTPSSATYSAQVCRGVNLIVTDRNVLDSPELGIELAAALRKLYPEQWKMDHWMTLLANQDIFDALSRGDDPRNIAQSWQDDLQKFRETRAKYLIYK